MYRKASIIIIIILVCYGILLLHNPSEGIKMAGYNSFLKYYGAYQLKEDDTKILYNPGLRKMDMALKEPIIRAALPHQGISYRQQMKNFLQSDGQVLVECSGLDSWHSSAEGCAYLPQLRSKAYRVIIFDGGHHLPALGLSPDIIIVPEYKGYAAHGYMQDGMKVTKLLEMLQRSHSEAILVTVSRWRLVKTEASLTGITRQVLARLNFRKTDSEPLQLKCRPRISKYHSYIFVYVNKDYASTPDSVANECRQIGVEGVKKIYLAFDYAWVNPNQAEKYVQSLQKNLGLKAERVNEPLKVTNLMLP